MARIAALRACAAAEARSLMKTWLVAISFLFLAACGGGVKQPAQPALQTVLSSPAVPGQQATPSSTPAQPSATQPPRPSPPPAAPSGPAITSLSSPVTVG